MISSLYRKGIPLTLDHVHSILITAELRALITTL